MAAKKVAEEPEPRLRQSARDRSGGSYNNEEETPMEIEEEELLSQPIDDSDGRIVRVAQYADRLVFEHSRNGKGSVFVDSVEVPVSWSDERPPNQPPAPVPSEKIQTANLEKIIAEYKRKVHTPLILT